MAKKRKKATPQAKNGKRENSANSKPSKFKEKYKDRVESIQNVESKIAENRKIAEEIERREAALQKDELRESIEKLNESRKRKK